jgi:hypothetical protein
MSVNHILIIATYGIACFAGSLAFVQCSERNAQKAIQEAEIETENMRAGLNMAIAENARLNESMAKYDAVLKTAITEIERAYEKNVERVEKIHDAPADWLQCELPRELQDVFAGYCDSNGDGDNETTGSAADSVRKADGIEVGSK